MHVVDKDGSTLHTLSGSVESIDPYDEAVEIDFSPSVSAEGSMVAFTTLRYATGHIGDHTWEIAVQGIDGCDRRRVTTNDWDDVSPSWSPDGSRIAFVSAREGDYRYNRIHRVFTIAADGSGERSLAPEIRAQTSPPVWSPDGSHVAFIGETEEVVNLPVLDTYSRPANLELWENSRLFREAVYVANAEGTSVKKLVWGDPADTGPRTRIGRSDIQDPEEEISHFQWSPDGKQIAFVAHFYGEPDLLYIANLDTEQVQQILDLSIITESEHYSSSGIRARRYSISIRGIAWSPDSSRISFEVGGGRVYGDTYHPVSGIYVLAADGSAPPVLLAETDDSRAYYKGEDSYLEWPAAMKSGRPTVAPESLLDYLKSKGFLVGTQPTRIVRYTEPMGLNVGRDVEGWMLTAVAWDGSSEKVLVKIVGNRVVAANPRQADNFDLVEQCSDDKVVPDAKENPGLVSDCRALLSIKDILAGDETLFWSVEFPIYEWPGIIVGGSPPRVHEITTLRGMSLSGTIPPAISELTELRVLNLENSELTGSLPPELGSLSKLEVLVIGENGRSGKMEGTIPPELGSLGNLERLKLICTGLTGSIPPELGDLSQLWELHLVGCAGGSLTGTIPHDLSRLNNLHTLVIVGHSISGQIPAELGDMPALYMLNLQNNDLTGTIPLELGNSESLEFLYLHGNHLTGCVPQELRGVWMGRSFLPECS